MDIDLLDRKILYALDSNARQSHTRIAKKLHVNRNVISYRIAALKEKGIIKGTFLERNNQRLGFLNMRLFIKFSNADYAAIQGYIADIGKDGRIMWLASVLGKWDLDMVYMVRSIAEFNALFERMMEKYNTIIDHTQLAILTKVKQYPKDYLLQAAHARRQETTYITISEEQHAVSDIDRNICALLSDAADLPLVQVAKKINISVATAKQHLKRLEKERIITGYRLFIDTEKLGLRYYKMHIQLRQYTASTLSSMEEWFFNKPYVIYSNKYLNGEHFEIELYVEKETELLAFQKELLSVFGRYIKEFFILQFYDVRVFRCFPS